MKRLVTAILVGATCALVFALKTPMQEWVAERALQRYCQATFGAPATYAQLHFANGLLTIENLQVQSPAGYQLSARRLVLPIHFGLSHSREWTIADGNIVWDSDGLTCQINSQDAQGTAIFANQLGCFQWQQDQGEFQHVSLPALLRLAQLFEPRLLAWQAESGTLQGQWRAGETYLYLTNPLISHRTFPFSLQAEAITATADQDMTLSIMAPIVVNAGSVISVINTDIRLDRQDDQTVRWIWQAPFEQPGQLITQLAFADDHIAITGDYFSRETAESLHYQVQVPSSGTVTGQLTGQALALDSALAPLANQLFEGKWSGRVDIEGSLQGSLLTAQVNPCELRVETPTSTIAFETLPNPISLSLDLRSSHLCATIHTDHSAFLDKNTGLLLTDISATIDVAKNAWTLREIEAFYQNLRFVGSGHYARSDATRSRLDLHVDTITGRLSQLQEMLVFLSPKGLVQVIALDGNVQLGDKGGDFSLVTHGQDRQLTVVAEGVLLDGAGSTRMGNASIQNVSAQFHYAYPANTLNLRDLQGSIFVGQEGGRQEEYQFSGDQLTFTDYATQQMQFDLWIGDRRRDVIRLAGCTRPGRDGVLHFHFDKAITHLGSVHPEVLELSLRHWTQVERFQLGLQFNLENCLRDLQRVERSGLFSIDDKLSSGFQALDSVDGRCRFEGSFERGANLFNYHLTSAQLSIDQHIYRDFELTGTIQNDAWVVDPLRWDQWAFSAELMKLPDRWRVDFLGIKFGDSVLAGLQGEYLLHEARVEGRIQLFDVDLFAIASLPLAGQWKSTGTFALDLTEFPHQYPLQAEFNGLCKGLVVNQTTWDQPVKGHGMITCAEKNPRLQLELRATGAAPLIKEAVLHADASQWSIETTVPYRDHHLAARYQTSWGKPESGLLKLTQADTSSDDAITVSWAQTNKRELSPEQINGTLFGVTLDLNCGPRVKSKGNSRAEYSAVGTVNLDCARLAPLLPASLRAVLERWHLGDGYALNGEWRANALLPDVFYFSGQLTGEQCALADWTFDALKGNLTIAPGDIQLTDVSLTDRAGRLHADKLTLTLAEASHWIFDCSQVICDGFDPAKMNGLTPAEIADYSEWSLPRISIEQFSGDFGDPTTYAGTGSLHFLRSSRLRTVSRASSLNSFFSKLPVPDLAMPVSGMIDWEVANNTVKLKSLKDVYSEGKLFKFSLLKNQTAATFDFDGNLNMRMRIKANRPLVKLNDKPILSIQGTWKDPQIALQDDK